MAHDPTRHWPLGVGPKNTSIPGAAWLELLDGQVFPVVGAGAMVWNGTMWMPVSMQNRLPVDAAVSGTVQTTGMYPEYRLLSTDPKPDAAAEGKGAVIFEIDTRMTYMSDGEDWEVI